VHSSITDSGSEDVHSKAVDHVAQQPWTRIRVFRLSNFTTLALRLKERSGSVTVDDVFLP
jgi:hypothetical protein